MISSKQRVRPSLEILALAAVCTMPLGGCSTVDSYTVYCRGGCEVKQTVEFEAIEDLPFDEFLWNDEPIGHVTFMLDGTLMRAATRPHAQALDLDALLDGLSVGSDESAGPSPSGVWLALNSSREFCREQGLPADGAAWNCLTTAQLGDRTRRLADGTYERTVGTFGVSALQPVRLSRKRLVHDISLPEVNEGGTAIVFSAQTGTSGEVIFNGPEGAINIYVVTRDPASQVWTDPRLLTGGSPFPYHSHPRLSRDGQKLLMDCFGDLDVTLPRSICEVGVDGTGFRVVIAPEMGDFDGRPPGLSGANHSPHYAPDGSVVFESDWADKLEDGWHRCEAVWRLAPGASRPEKLDGRCDDNTPCVLPDGRVVSLWLPNGGHELKVLDPTDGRYFMLMDGRDVTDVSVGCSW